MAALSRPEKANYEIHEHVKVDTTDLEDHTFWYVPQEKEAGRIRVRNPCCCVCICHLFTSFLLSLSFVYTNIYFSGIMFPICIKQDLPLDHLVIRSVAVRGYLGPMTVWISKPQNRNFMVEDYQYWGQDQWTRIYQKRHEPSRRAYQSLVFDQPILLKGGEVRILYIHSTAPHD